jgi:hypothetical protein
MLRLIALLLIVWLGLRLGRRLLLGMWPGQSGRRKRPRDDAGDLDHLTRQEISDADFEEIKEEE